MHPYRRLRVAMASAPGTAACAACRVLRRKCTAQCLFAPYFPPDQPQKFAHVHKVFGVANVTKMLHELPPPHREDCVNSLAYEADARVQDPVYGCVGAISVLQQQVPHLQAQLSLATSEIARLRETFAIAAAASTHNNSSINNNGNSNTNTSNGTNTIPSSNNAMITNGNGNAATGGGALFMAALQPHSRSSSPHCLVANGISNNNHASALTAAATDQDSPQGLLLRSNSHNEHNNSNNNNNNTMNCSSTDNNNNNHSHNHNHSHSQSQNNNHANNDITQSATSNTNMIENEITLVTTSSR